MTRLSDAIQEYMEYRTRSGKAPSTVRTERSGLDLLLATVGNIQVKHLDARHGEEYMAALIGKGSAPGTVNLRRAAYKRFCEWCRLRRYLPPGNHPLGTTQNMRNPQKPRRRIPQHDFERLLDTAEHPQERIIIALGLYLFVRISETADLSVGDVHLDEGYIVVYQRKTGKTDEMPITEEMDAELRRWLTWYANDAARVKGPLMDSWPLVPARHSPGMVNDGSGLNGGRPAYGPDNHMNPASRLTLGHRKVQKVLRDFGWEVTKREGGHTLRRSGARAYYDALIAAGEVKDGVIREVMAMLHHATQSQTEVYLGLEIDRERRDARLRGKRMFPKAPANVVTLRPAVGSEERA